MSRYIRHDQMIHDTELDCWIPETLSNSHYAELVASGAEIEDYVKPEPTLAEAKEMQKKEIARLRWEAETGGITIGGMTIDTSRESQGLITGAALQATLDPTYSCRWKTAGGFVELTAPMILGVATAVRQHVQACFDQEATLLMAIEAAKTAKAVQKIVWA